MIAVLEKTLRNELEDVLREAPPARRASLFVVGLNHKRAPLTVRERFALTPEQCGQRARTLREEGLAEQILMLSTCNRTEIYAFGSGTGFAERLRAAFLALAPDAPAEAPLYEHRGMAAVEHLFAVCAGLDSMILGENQIKQQLRHAWQIARDHETDGPDLCRVVEAAFRVGKRIRTETDLNVGTLDVGKAAVMKGEQVLGGLAGRRCMVIGAGKIGRTAARAIAEREPEVLYILNRSPENAEALAVMLGSRVRAHPLDDLPVLLPDVEFILGAANAPGVILDRARYEAACGTTHAQCVVMVDAAVPHIFDRSLDEVPSIALFDIEQMQGIVEENRRRRETSAQAAWKIVEESVEQYRQALRNAELAPLIRRLTQRVDALLAETFAEDDQQTGDEEAREHLRRQHHRLRGKLLHEIITELKRWAAAQDAD